MVEEKEKKAAPLKYDVDYPNDNENTGLISGKDKDLKEKIMDEMFDSGAVDKLEDNLAEVSNHLLSGC